jgi:hypothetical protein
VTDSDEPSSFSDVAPSREKSPKATVRIPIAAFAATARISAPETPGGQRLLVGVRLWRQAYRTAACAHERGHAAADQEPAARRVYGKTMAATTSAHPAAHSTALVIASPRVFGLSRPPPRT